MNDETVIMNYHGQVPAWAELAAQHGWSRTARHEASPDPRKTRAVLIGVLVVLALFVLGASAYLITTHLQRDSGVAACKAMVSGAGPAGKGDRDWTATEYLKARQTFADSNRPAIRDNGVRLVDVIWQMQGLNPDDLGNLVFVNTLVSAYAGLAGGCAEAGYTLPPLGS